MNVEKIDTSIIKVVGYVKDEANYVLYSDDGINSDTNDSKSYLNIIIKSVGENIEVSYELQGTTLVKEIHFDVVTSDNNRKKGVYYV